MEIVWSALGPRARKRFPKKSGRKNTCHGVLIVAGDLHWRAIATLKQIGAYDFARRSIGDGAAVRDQHEAVRMASGEIAVVRDSEPR